MKAIGLGIIAIFFIIALTLLLFVLTQAKEAAKYKNATIIYLVITALCIGIACLTGFLGLIDDHFTFFIVIQALFLIIGSLNAWLLYRLLPWASKDKFIWEFLFTFVIACFGAIFSMLVFTFLLHIAAFQYVMLSALAWFFVPFFFAQAYNRYLAIPSRIYKTWQYPVGREISDPLDSELVSLFVISFVFHKKMNDPEITTFRAKAPAKMVFGRLFFYFLNDYNDRHRESPIEFLDLDHHPYGWIFYHKPWWIKRRYIDPDLFINRNHIRENSVIYCQRIKES
jgi:hypothetical protein